MISGRRSRLQFADEGDGIRAPPGDVGAVVSESSGLLEEASESIDGLALLRGDLREHKPEVPEGDGCSWKSCGQHDVVEVCVGLCCQGDSALLLMVIRLLEKAVGVLPRAEGFGGETRDDLLPQLLCFGVILPHDPAVPPIRVLDLAEHPIEESESLHLVSWNQSPLPSRLHEMGVRELGLKVCIVSLSKGPRGERVLARLAVVERL